MGAGCVGVGGGCLGDWVGDGVGLGGDKKFQSS